MDEKDKAWNNYFNDRTDSNKIALAELYITWMINGPINSYSIRNKVPKEELVTPGFIGLCKAIERYCPKKEIKFITYAWIRVQGEIKDLARTEQIGTRRLNSQTKKVFKQIHTPDNTVLCNNHFKTVDEVIEATDMPQVMREEVRSKVCRKLGIRRELSVEDSKITSAGEDRVKETVEDLLRSLSSLERECITSYWLEGITMKEIGTRLGLSESRVSQLNAQALEVMRNAAKY